MTKRSLQIKEFNIHNHVSYRAQFLLISTICRQLFLVDDTLFDARARLFCWNNDSGFEYNILSRVLNQKLPLAGDGCASPVEIDFAFLHDIIHLVLIALHADASFEINSELTKSTLWSIDQDGDITIRTSPAKMDYIIGWINQSSNAKFIDIT